MKARLLIILVIATTIFTNEVFSQVATAFPIAKGKTESTDNLYHSGRLGIGTNSPSSNYKLDVNGNINFTGVLYQNGNIYTGSSLWNTNSNGINYNNGFVGIGTDNPQTLFHISSDSESDYTAIRLKEMQIHHGDETKVDINYDHYWDIENDGPNLNFNYNRIEEGLSPTIETMIHFNGSGVYATNLNGDNITVKNLNLDMCNIYTDNDNVTVHMKPLFQYGLKLWGDIEIGDANTNFWLKDGYAFARELTVQAQDNYTWPDYVFKSDYKLISIPELENYINENKHLPEVPSAEEIEENGIQVGEMNAILLKKIEELTLYTIEQQKLIENMQKQIDAIRK